MKLILAISSLVAVSMANAHSQIVASPRTGSPIQTVKPAPDVKSLTKDQVDAVGAEDESDRVDVDYGFPLTTGALIVEYWIGGTMATILSDPSRS